MPEKYFEMQGLSPLLFGTGRAFSNDAGALSAPSFPFPFPGTVAGTLRNEVARRSNWMDYKDEYRDKLLQVSLRGPILKVNDSLYFPAPQDAWIVKLNGKDKFASLVPHIEDGCGTNLPEGMLPCTIPKNNETIEPSKFEAKSFWSEETLVEWLLNTNAFQDIPSNAVDIPIETRTHVQIDVNTKASKREILFKTQGACISENLGLNEYLESFSLEQLFLCGSFRYDSSLGLAELSSCAITLGGEKRLAAFNVFDTDEVFKCPEKIIGALDGAKFVRMVLVTPAYFKDGWKPEWSSINGVGLTLKGACVGRRAAFSSWDRFDASSKTGGPRPLEYLVPAGSVYFFEVNEGNAKALANLWLQPVSDDDQRKRDGFGLAVWGIWNAENKEVV